MRTTLATSFLLILATCAMAQEGEGAPHGAGAMPAPVAVICLDQESAEETTLSLEHWHTTAAACADGQAAFLKLGGIELTAGADPLPSFSQERQAQDEEDNARADQE